MASKPLMTGLAVAVVLLAAAAALKIGQHAGIIDRNTVESAFQALMGLMVAFYGNLIPKNLGRSRGVEHDRRMQPVLRVSGWAFTLAGLAYAVLAFVQPREVADAAGMFAIASALAITLVAAFRCVAFRDAGGGAQ